MERRTFWKLLAGTPFFLGFARHALAAQASSLKEVGELQRNWKMLLADGADVAASATPPLNRSNVEWKKSLAPASYDVLREGGTERPGTSPLKAEKRTGVFVCAGCSLPLCTSAMKFESGTGWPSFFTAIPDALGTK